ncbi:MAG: hypothetical protein WDO24_23310 [Pseudomonadota bacterium]
MLATGFANNLESGGYLASNPGLSALSPFLSGSYTDPMSNPNVANTVTELTSKAVPGVVSQFVAGGDLNNPAMAYATAQGATDAIAPYLSSLYSTGMQNQLTAAQDAGSLYNQGVQTATQGLAMAPQTAQLPFVAPNQEYQAGTLEQNQNQAQLNAAIQAWNYNQTLPENMDNWLASIAYGAPGGTSTMTTPMYSNDTNNTLGTISSAASTVGMLAAMY